MLSIGSTIMAVRPSTSETLTLAFEVLKRIPKHRKVTASELHQELISAGIERDIRTIQRNLEMLSEHFDIEKDSRSKPYGYSWHKHSPGFSLSGSLSPQESLLLCLAEQYLSNLLPSNVMNSLQGFFTEAKYQLNPTKNTVKERDWIEKVRVVSETQPLLPPAIDTEVFNIVSYALFHNRWLSIDYINAKQEKKNVRVMPLGLAQQGARLYLVCRFEGYENERSLALHRIQAAKASSFGFDRPQNFQLRQYDADGRFGFGEGETCFLEFCIDKKAGNHLLETPLSEHQQVKEFSDYYQISATVIRSKQLVQWLNSFGEDVWGVNILKSVGKLSQYRDI